MIFNNKIYASVLLGVGILASCSSMEYEPVDVKSESEKVTNNTHATKLINGYDDLGYYTIHSSSGAMGSGKLSYEISKEDRISGSGSLKIDYTLTGQSITAGPETVYFEECIGDFRTDLSFHPLGISVWVKGHPENKGTFRFVLMEDEKQFWELKPFDGSRKRWNYYAFEDKEVLSKEGWNRVVMPYNAFELIKQGEGSTSRHPKLNRLEGYRIEIINEDGEICENGQIHIDALEQLTSFQLQPNKAKFSSIFIQLNVGAYDKTDWDQEFKDSKAIGIDTWIVQYAQQYTDNHSATGTSFYKNTELNWVTTKLDYLDKMFEAAARNDFKIVLGLYPGVYSKVDNTEDKPYRLNMNRNKALFDEVYEQFGSNPCLAGWYITEEFHDGMTGWQQEPALSKLAGYLEGLSSYIKSKSDKPVLVAPALWRGMPADISGQWFGRLLKKTPSIDFLYLQDCAGRGLADYDVDLPNWFAEVKKGCEAAGVKFGVDIETFMETRAIPYRAKYWEEIKDQLTVAGMFTEYITNFSWVTFKKGTDGYRGYRQYLEENGLLEK